MSVVLVYPCLLVILSLASTIQEPLSEYCFVTKAFEQSEKGLTSWLPSQFLL